MTLANQDFQLFRDFLEKACGIVLGDNKQYLVSSRLNRLLEQEGIANLGELVKRIQAQPRGGLHGVTHGVNPGAVTLDSG